ncbi:MAG: polysulfide reductase [Nitrososphaeria archaeon]|nr:polysulfide reductase [Nitrososphaeria archaeon]
MYGPFNVYWGVLIVFYPFITGLVAGAFIVSTLAYVFGKEQYVAIAKLALIISTLFAVICSIPLIADLGQPTRALEIFTRSHFASPMSVFGWVLGSYIILCVVEGWFLFREGNIKRSGMHVGIKRSFYSLLALGSEDLSESSLNRDKTVIKALGFIGIPLASIVHAYVGLIFGAVTGRALWMTPLMPLIFLSSAIISGIALLIVVSIIMEKFFTSKKKINRELMYSLGGLLAWVILFDLSLNVLEIITRFFAGVEEWFAMSLLLTGELSFSFVWVQIIMGLVIPVIMLSIPSVRRSIAGEVIASLFVLIGVFAMRWNVVIGGQLIPRTGQAFLTYAMESKDLSALISIGALGLFLYMIGVWILPWEYEAPTGLVKTNLDGGIEDG